jgi:hypothetical protein
MTRLELTIHAISILALMVTLYLLSSGAISEEPAAVSVFLSLLAELLAVKSSLPTLQMTPLEKEVISHLKEKGNKERKSDFDGFLREQLDKEKENSNAIFDSLKERGLVVTEKVSGDQAIYEEVKLSLRGRLG